MLIITKGNNAGGEAAHLGGMAAGAAYVFSQSLRIQMRLHFRSALWKRKLAADHRLQLQLDHILQKVRNSGIHTLTAKEKKILQRATEKEREKFNSPP